MSSRPLLRPQVVLPLTLANTNLTSAVTNINMISLVSYTVVWQNGVTGTFSVEGCNDYVDPVGVQDQQQASGSWVPVPLTAPVAAAGVADDALIALSSVPFCYVRLVFTDGSGGANVGKITATLAGKVA